MLEARLANLSATLALPADADLLVTKTGDAAAALDGVSLSETRAALTNISSLLGDTSGDVGAIGAAVAAYIASTGPWVDVWNTCFDGMVRIKVGGDDGMDSRRGGRGQGREHALGRALVMSCFAGSLPCRAASWTLSCAPAFCVWVCQRLAAPQSHLAPQSHPGQSHLCVCT